MEDWKRVYYGEQQQPQRGGGGFFHQGGGGGGAPHTRSSSKNGKPPTSGSWQPTVPAWEKKFCYSVSRIPWGKICEAKKMMSYYKNIVEWDDSAGEEAFQNAKARFWAKINNLSCHISLPDPDSYIDEIDWDAEIDPQLLLDLDKQPPPPDDEEKDGKLGFLSSGWDSSLFANKPVPCTGWGDAEGPASTPLKCSPAELDWESWDSKGKCGNARDAAKPVKDTSAEPSWGNWDRNGNSGHAWDCSGGWDDGALEDKSLENKRGNSWGLWEDGNNEVHYSEPRRYDRKREGGTQYGFGYQSSRHPGDDYQLNNGRNCRGRRWTNNWNERSAYEKKPLALEQWNSMHSCGPINRQGSAGARSNWRWEKPIS